jgi:hypothetical protein
MWWKIRKNMLTPTNKPAPIKQNTAVSSKVIPEECAGTPIQLFARATNRAQAPNTNRIMLATATNAKIISAIDFILGSKYSHAGPDGLWVALEGQRYFRVG